MGVIGLGDGRDIYRERKKDLYKPRDKRERERDAGGKRRMETTCGEMEVARLKGCCCGGWAGWSMVAALMWIWDLPSWLLLLPLILEIID